MRTVDLIQKKRDKKPLTAEEWSFIANGAADGSIPDYQIAALLMASFFNGLDEKETAALTMAIANSGDVVDLSEFPLSADKHSTGGVGDKTTLIVAPIVAACGGQVAKMSGRGLGHTGGTIDKLEAIPGFSTSLSPSDFREQVRKIGISVVGQTGNLAPADKTLYALRGLTATVDELSLITASIMGKKLAAGTKNIVLDVKTGSGSFAKTPERSVRLAKMMVTIGNACGKNVSAMITDMDQPLGNAIGNSLEVIEAIEVLKGRGPHDLRTVSLALASELISLCLNIPYTEAESRAEKALQDSSALNKLSLMIKAQGGDERVIFDYTLFKKPLIIHKVLSKQAGFIAHTDAETIGTASMILGAGRNKKEDDIDPSAGIILFKKRGDLVEVGDVLAELHTSDEKTLAAAEERFLSAFSFSEESPAQTPLIFDIIRN